MLSLPDIVTRSSPPTAWREGDNIPWDKPPFSERMLCEHLSQDHDLASRRLSLIDSQVARLLATVIPAAPARVLDLACGPGLYLSRIAGAGHCGVGIDFSPASIDHARSEADAAGHDLTSPERPPHDRFRDRIRYGSPPVRTNQRVPPR